MLNSGAKGAHGVGAGVPGNIDMKKGVVSQVDERAWIQRVSDARRSCRAVEYARDL